MTDVQKDGAELLFLFKCVQATHGNRGCTCSNCVNDMIKAYEMFLRDKT